MNFAKALAAERRVRRNDPSVSQRPGLDWLAAGKLTPMPTKSCRHSKRDPKPRPHFRQIQCPHCGLWSLWVLR